MKKLIKPIMKDNSEKIMERVLRACEYRKYETNARKEVINLADQMRYIDTIEEWRTLDNDLSHAGASMVHYQSLKNGVLHDLTEDELAIYHILIH